MARYSAAVQLEGVDGEWTWDGTLSIAEDGGDWLVEWAPAEHPPRPEPRASTWPAAREVPERAPILDASRQPAVDGPPRPRHRPRAPGRPRPQPGQGRVPAAARHRSRGHRRAAQRPRRAARPLRRRSPPSTSVRYDQVGAGHLPAARAPGSATRSCAAGPPPSTPPTCIGSLRRDHRRAPRRAGRAVPGGRPGRAERARGALRGAARRHPVDHHPGGRRGRDGRGRRPPLRGPAARAGADDHRPHGAVRGRGGARHDHRPHRRSWSSTRRATSGPWPPGRSASTTGPWPASTPPGSTFKIVTTSALLGRGVTPDTPVECAPTINAGGRSFRNFEQSSLGTVPFGLAFAQSCNTAFISAAADVPDPDFVAAAESFGFNSEYSVGLDTDSASFPHAGRRHRARGRRHRPGTGDGQPAAHGHGRRAR